MSGMKTLRLNLLNAKFRNPYTLLTIIFILLQKPSGFRKCQIFILLTRQNPLDINIRLIEIVMIMMIYFKSYSSKKVVRIV